MIYILDVSICALSKMLATLRPCQYQFVLMCWFIDLIHHPSAQKPACVCVHSADWYFAFTTEAELSATREGNNLIGVQPQHQLFSKYLLFISILVLGPLRHRWLYITSAVAHLQSCLLVGLSCSVTLYTNWAENTQTILL